MLHSVLLLLDGGKKARGAIRLGVNLSQCAEARLRGVSLLDTRQIGMVSSTCESALFTLQELHRQKSNELDQHLVRSDLSQACLEAKLDFDVRRISGDPFEMLPLEARFHDLVVAGAKSRHDAPSSETSSSVELSVRELSDLLWHGVQPMLIVPSDIAAIRRVLLVYEGTVASGRAIRSFLAQRLFPTAELRLLAVGQDEGTARRSLREMADYCRDHRVMMETGLVAGPLRRHLVPYASKWEADLVVLGITRTNPLLRTLFGDTVTHLFQHLSCALYATT